MHDLATMTASQFADIARDGCVVLPIGATEQHGSHLPIGTDSLIARHIAERSAKVLAEHVAIGVAPTLSYGFSGHHLALGGTLSLDPRTFLDCLLSLGESLSHVGVTRLMIVNGHGGNQDLMLVAARALALESRMHVGALSWWDASPTVRELGEGRGWRVPGHAGPFETSVLAAIEPELVRGIPEEARFFTRLGQIPGRGVGTRVRFEHPGFIEAIGGVSDDPRTFDSTIGSKIIAAATEGLAENVKSFIEASGRADHLRDDIDGGQRLAETD